MLPLTLEKAQEVIRLALSYARENSLTPLAVAVLDARASVKALSAEDGVPIGWSDIAIGKARGALMMSVDSRVLGEQAVERPHFIAGVNHAIGGVLVPVAGGVLIHADGVIVGSSAFQADGKQSARSSLSARLFQSGRCCSIVTTQSLSQ